MVQQAFRITIALVLLLCVLSKPIFKPQPKFQPKSHWLSPSVVANLKSTGWFTSQWDTVLAAKHNIYYIGPGRVGKSTLANTDGTRLTGNYQNLFPTGDGSQPKTESIRRVDVLGDVCLIDVPGLQITRDTDVTARRILRGNVPEGTTVVVRGDYFHEKKSRNHELEATCVVFVFEYEKLDELKRKIDAFRLTIQVAKEHLRGVSDPIIVITKADKGRQGDVAQLKTEISKYAHTSQDRIFVVSSYVTEEDTAQKISDTDNEWELGKLESAMSQVSTQFLRARAEGKGE